MKERKKKKRKEEKWERWWIIKQQAIYPNP
jgi:hypothetical protein